MRVSEIMTSPVVAIDPSTTVAHAARLMLDGHISGLPVVDAAKKLVGVVTESDFLRRGELGTERKRPRWLEFIVGSGREADEYVHANSRRVAEVMSHDPVSIMPDASLEDVVKLMTSRRIKRLPVLADGKLVGIVARSDLMRAMLRAIPEPSEAPHQSDAQIERAVNEVFAKHPWGGFMQARVAGAVVTLKGAVYDMRAKDAARVAAENVAGVSDVIDKLIWIDGMSGTCIFPEELNRQASADQQQD